MSPDVIGVFIPIIAIVMGVGLAMVAQITSYRRRSQALEQRHKERLAAIDKGIEPPPETADPESQMEAQLELAKALRQPRYLLRGLIYAGAGAALIATWSGPGDNVIRSIGWVLAAVGIAQLIYYAVEGRKERERSPGPPTSP